MNNNIFESYPVITPNAIIDLAVNNSFEVSYKRGDYLCKMNHEKVNELNEKIFIVTCPNDDWKPNLDNFIVNGRISIKNPNRLFKENKIVEDDAVIGVAIRAYSKDSKINITNPIGELRKSNEELENSSVSIGYDVYFKKSELSEKVYLEVFLYLKQKSSKNTIFASEIGSILGEIYSFELIIEGNGSLFPIKLFSDKTKPLWTMDVSYDDLDDELSSRNICLKLNNLHKDFKIIGSNDINKENVYLWKEILASFFENLFISLDSSELTRICDTNDTVDGSVGKFLQSLAQMFCISKYDIENNRPGLSEKIRLSLDNLLSWS